MSNRASIKSTEFREARGSHNSTFGIRVYDDHGQAYDNTWETVPDDDLEILRLATKCTDSTIISILSLIEEEEKGIEIDGTWYDWEEIKQCFE